MLAFISEWAYVYWKWSCWVFNLHLDRHIGQNFLNLPEYFNCVKCFFSNPSVECIRAPSLNLFSTNTIFLGMEQMFWFFFSFLEKKKKFIFEDLQKSSVATGQPLLHKAVYAKRTFPFIAHSFVKIFNRCILLWKGAEEALPSTFVASFSWEKSQECVQFFV